LTTENEVTQEMIDAAIVQCLRIFAARGRQLRLQREHDQLVGAPSLKENADAKTIPAESQHLQVISSALAMKEQDTKTAKDQVASSDVSSDESECLSSTST
jgi:hypothetical protein